ncbi:diadenylate cyclase CdaA [Thermoproteota archaeon]
MNVQAFLEIIKPFMPFIRSVSIILDIFIVFIITYKFLQWIANTHAKNLVKGLALIFFIYIASHIMGLTVLNWLLGKFTTVLLLIVIIVFQPELRRFLERIGTPAHLFTPLLVQEDGKGAIVIKQILEAVKFLSKERIGTIIAIELSTNLYEYIETGIKISGQISSELLSNLFWPSSPTHDGAVIIRANKIEAAGCLLPLTETILHDRRLGTRHRAAIGLTELTDALVIITSEETGIISMAENGKLTRYLTKEALETRLFNLYKERPEGKKNTLFDRIKIPGIRKKKTSA